MKYGLNHPWKFREYMTTYNIGWLQSSVSGLSEVISIAILLGTRTYIDAVKDFIALVVVNDFDNMLFAYLKDENLSKLIANGEVEVGCIKLKLADLLRIETTSADKPENEFGQLRKIPELEPIFKDNVTPYKNTGCGNKQDRP